MAAPLRSGCSYTRWRFMCQANVQVAKYSRKTFQKAATELNSSHNDQQLSKLKDVPRFDMFRKEIEMRVDQALRSVWLTCNEQEVPYVLTALQNRYSRVVQVNCIKKRKEMQLLVELQDMPCPHPFIIDKNKFLTTKMVDKTIGSRVNMYKMKTLNLLNCKDVSDQIMHLYDVSKLSEAMTRQCFFVGELIRYVINAVHPSARVHMFGSSVHGCGLEGKSDLDLVVLLNGKETHEVLSRLRSEIRKKIYNQMFAQVIYLPGARVPILKFKNVGTGMECDVACNNLGGILMAEMLFWLNKYEPMFYPLLTTVKIWASKQGLTCSGPSRLLTNHMLTMLVIAFLQQQKRLPPLEMVYMDKAVLMRLQSEDLISTLDNAWLKRPDIVSEKACGTELCMDDIGTLLHHFFKYYSEINFDRCLIDIGYGKIINSHHMNAIYMPNPYEKKHNMCRNVGFNTMVHFKNICEHSARSLNTRNKRIHSMDEWGLMTILSEKEIKNNIHKKLFKVEDFIDFDDDKGDIAHTQSFNQELESISNKNLLKIDNYIDFHDDIKIKDGTAHTQNFDQYTELESASQFVKDKSSVKTRQIDKPMNQDQIKSQAVSKKKHNLSKNRKSVNKNRTSESVSMSKPKDELRLNPIDIIKTIDLDHELGKVRERNQYLNKQDGSSMSKRIDNLDLKTEQSKKTQKKPWWVKKKKRKVTES